MTALDDFWARVHRWAAQYTAAQQQAYFAGITILLANLSDASIVTLIGAHDINGVIAATLTDADIDLAFARFRAEMQQTTRDAVLYFGRDIPGVGGGVATMFNILNPNVIEAVRVLDDTVMRTVRTDIRETVRAAIAQGLQDGVGPRTIAASLRDVLGLSPNQLAAVQNYRTALEGGPVETVYQQALDALLRDRRFDNTVAAAKEGGYSLTTHQVDTMTKAYSRKMLAFHAETNARTATLNALKLGQQLSWQDAIDKGIVDEGSLMKSWKGVMDSRERFSHVIMEGDTVPFNDPYSNGQDYPGEGEFNCRCLSIVYVDASRAVAA